MNGFVPEPYAENAHRLALGIEPRDALHRRLVPRPVSVTPDGAEVEQQQPVDRHRSGRFVVRFGKGVESPIGLRFTDPTRHYVPRRLAYPIVELDAVLTAEPGGVDIPADRRTRRPVLFPGAAYDVEEGATGIRGRVHRDDAPLRWARVEARMPSGDPVVGRAHGDDRGEFLLVLSADPDSAGDLPDLLDVDVTVFGIAPAALPADPVLRAVDPLWDLPREVAPGPGVAPDAVSSGDQLPPSYTRSATRRLRLVLGRLTSVQQPFVV